MNTIIQYVSSLNGQQYAYFVIWGMFAVTVMHVWDLTKDHWDEDAKVMALCCHIVLETNIPNSMARIGIVDTILFVCPRLILGAVVYKYLTPYDMYAFLCLSFGHAIYSVLPWIVGYTEYRKHPEAYQL